MSQIGRSDIVIEYKLAMVTFIAAAIVVGLRFVARILYAHLDRKDYVMMFAAVCAPGAILFSSSKRNTTSS